MNACEDCLYCFPLDHNDIKDLCLKDPLFAEPTLRSAIDARRDLAGDSVDCPKFDPIEAPVFVHVDGE